MKVLLTWDFSNLDSLSIFKYGIQEKAPEDNDSEAFLGFYTRLYSQVFRLLSSVFGNQEAIGSGSINLPFTLRSCHTMNPSNSIIVSCFLILNCK